MIGKSVIATPPGRAIKEQLDDRNITLSEFAGRMGMPEEYISQLINGTVLLMPDTASRLEAILGIPAEFWNNLEAIYQGKKQIIESENAMDTEFVKLQPQCIA